MASIKERNQILQDLLNELVRTGSPGGGVGQPAMGITTEPDFQTGISSIFPQLLQQREAAGMPNDFRATQFIDELLKTAGGNSLEARKMLFDSFNNLEYDRPPHSASDIIGNGLGFRGNKINDEDEFVRILNEAVARRLLMSRGR